MVLWLLIWHRLKSAVQQNDPGEANIGFRRGLVRQGVPGRHAQADAFELFAAALFLRRSWLQFSELIEQSIDAAFEAVDACFELAHILCAIAIAVEACHSTSG